MQHSYHSQSTTGTFLQGLSLRHAVVARQILYTENISLLLRGLWRTQDNLN